MGNDGHLQLFNEQGQEILSIKEPNKQLLNVDLRSIRAGHYYLILKNGEQVYYTQQLLKM